MFSLKTHKKNTPYTFLFCFLISTYSIPSNNSSFNFLSSINRCCSKRGHNCLLVHYHLNLWLSCAPYKVLSLSLFSKEHEWVMNDHSQGSRSEYSVRVPAQARRLSFSKSGLFRHTCTLSRNILLK